LLDETAALDSSPLVALDVSVTSEFSTMRVTSRGTSSRGVERPYQATTMTPRTPVRQLKTRATIPRGVKLKEQCQNIAFKQRG
jgi:hypothetical protein